MAPFLRIWGMLSLVFAVVILVGGRSVIHEIEAGVALVIMTLSFGLSAIIDAMHQSLATTSGRRFNIIRLRGVPCGLHDGADGRKINTQDVTKM